MDIKSCPFCGGMAHLDFAHGSNQIYLKKNGFIGETPFLYVVFCEDCHVKTIPCEDMKLAIQLWNRRINDV